MLRKIIAAAAIIVVVVAISQYFRYFNTPLAFEPVVESDSSALSSDTSASTSLNVSSASTSSSSEEAALIGISNQSISDSFSENIFSENTLNSTASSAAENVAVQNNPASSVSDDTLAGSNASELGLDLYSIGRGSMPDAEFDRLTVLLNNNPALMSELFNEFRYETDPQRLTKLSQLLGQFDHPDIADLAREMVYSGNAQSQKAALDLLRQTQGTNPEARDVLIDMLALESAPEVLSVALNAVNTRNQATAGQVQTVVSNVISLAQHEDPIIRARSLATLAEWTEDDQSTQVLLDGLSDADSRVRQKTAYALVDYPYSSDIVVSQLLAVAENTAEEQRTRKAALLALGKKSLTTEQRQRAKAASDDVNRVRR